VLKKWIFTLSLTLLTACASTQAPGVVESAEPQEKIFKDGYDDVWRALQLAMATYPIKVNNQDSGVLETEPIRGDAAWVSPGQKNGPIGGFRYRIIVRVVRGRTENNRSAVKVTILKQGEIQRDFFSSYEKLPSDGLEELSIMYRIERELNIERMIRRSSH
jgi:hypothetical protein